MVTCTIYMQVLVRFGCLYLPIYRGITAISRRDAENPRARVPCGGVGERERGRGKEEAGREAPECSPGTMEHKWLQMDCEGDRAEAEASLKGEEKRG